MNDFITRYIEHRLNSCSPKTLDNIKSFLNCYGHSIINGIGPEEFYAGLYASGKSEYTISVYFMMAAQFYSFVAEGENRFAKWKERNMTYFKNVYDRKEVGFSYEEVQTRINAGPDGPEKTAALYLLATAQRTTEAGFKRTHNEAKNEDLMHITGKGAKRRINLGQGMERPDVLYLRLYRWLKKYVGVPPHALRKLALTRASRNGARLEDLCAIAGWSDIRTAYKYLEPQNGDKLKELLK